MIDSALILEVLGISVIGVSAYACLYAIDSGYKNKLIEKERNKVIEKETKIYEEKYRAISNKQVLRFRNPTPIYEMPEIVKLRKDYEERKRHLRMDINIFGRWLPDPIMFHERNLYK
jgi:hypothetical protein